MPYCTADLTYWTVSDLFLAVGKIPAKFIKLPANRFLHPVQWPHTKADIADENAAGCKYEFVHTELYDIKWISSSAFEFEKNNK